MRLYCHCLNVSIDVLQLNTDHQTITQYIPTELLQVVNVQQHWVLYDAPSDSSEHIKWKTLLQSTPVHDMKLNRCLGCFLYTHITLFGQSRILINRDLFNEHAAQCIHDDSNFSKVANIMLPAKVNSVHMPRLSSSQDENVQHECEIAQQICRQRIEDLERDTEEKIRIFQREQEELLQQQTAKINSELERFLSLLHSVSRHAANTKGSPTLQSSSYINENSMESGVGSDIFETNSTEYGRHTLSIERPLSERNANIDDDINDDTRLDNGDWLSDTNSTSNFATSLPQTINFPPTSRFFIPQQEDESVDEMERIGRSFRDLSRSVCRDGTELFGDLPSPRHNIQQT